MSRRTLVAVAMLTCVICGLIAAIALLTARNALLAGLTATHQAESQLRGKQLESVPAIVLARVRRSMVRAHDDFQSADDRLRLLAPILHLLGGVPRVGNQLAAAPDLARVANQSSRGVLALIDGVEPISREWAKAGRRVPADTLLRELARQHSTFDQAYHLFGDAQRSRRALYAHPVESLASSLHSLDVRLPQLRLISHGLLLAPNLLGETQARTYLIAYQNQNELRATGGFIGSAGFLNLRAGKATQRFQGTDFGSIENTSVRAPEPMELYNREYGWLFRDSNWSPDFPTTANLERFFVHLSLHRDVSSVVNVTAQAAANVLAATGPFYSPEYRRTITAGNVAQLSDFYAHRTTAYGPYIFGSKDTQRKQFILIVAHHILENVSNLSLRQWNRLVSAVATSIARRDLLLYYRRPEEEALVRQLGASGEIDHTAADYLYVVDSNLSYNKINAYVHTAVTYQATIQPDRWLRVRVTLRYTNQPAPAIALRGAFGPGEGTLGGVDDYADFVRVYVPAGAQLIDQSGWTNPWTPGPAYGKTMFCGYLIVRAGQTSEVRLQYVVPPNIFIGSRGRSYQLYVQHQPGSHPLWYHISVTTDQGQSTSWAIDRPVLDWRRDLPIPLRPYAPIPPAALPGGNPQVTPGHWIEPHAYFGIPTSRG